MLEERRSRGSLVLHLPFVPEPYPEEILGSWLARVSLHNGRGAWRVLLETSGFGRRVETPMFDMVDYSDKNLSLLEKLGLGYEQAMLKMTTLPYWLAFEGDEPGKQTLPGMAETPVILRKGRRVPLSLGALGVSRPGREARRVAYCPRCLEEDAHRYGEPFWRREHQLPNVFFCHRHLCATRAACWRCGRVAAAAAKRLIDLPKLRCECRADLRVVPKAKPPPAAFLELAKLSAGAVSERRRNWHGGQVKAYVQSQLAGTAERGLVGTYPQVLEKGYGARMLTPASGRLAISVPGAGPGNGVELGLSRYLSMAGAPEYCAVLAAMGFDWETATAGFTSAKVLIASQRRAPLGRNELSVECARSGLLDWSRRFPNRPLAAKRDCYWCLRLQDQEWFSENFPCEARSIVPSLDADRQKIEELIGSGGSPEVGIYTRVRHCAAGVRAYFRDQEWLLEKLEMLAAETKNDSKERNQNLFNQRVRALQKALEDTLGEEERPARIFATMLGARVGLTHAQAGEIIRRHPPLKEAIEIANRGKERRQLRWAMRELLKEGKPLSKTGICAKASLPTSRRALDLVVELRTELNSESWSSHSG